jgi:hypothetical protein
MSNVELTEWRRALQPIAAGIFRRLPEQGMARLSGLLNSGNSPLRSTQFTDQDKGGRPRAAQHSGGWSFGNMFNSECRPASWGSLVTLGSKPRVKGKMVGHL